MENAAKGLVIAGGMLLAIMILTLLVYALTTTSRIEIARAEAERTEELTRFNMEFEAYNKKLIYGIDIISLINKAMENNEKMNALPADSRHYINVVFTTNQTFKNEIYIVKKNKETGDEQVFDDLSDGACLTAAQNIYIDGNSLASLFGMENIEINAGYNELGQMHDSGRAFIANKNFATTFTEGTIKDVIEKKYEDSRYIYTFNLYSALTGFKKAVFTSLDPDYINERISTLYFEQREVKNR